MLHPSKLYSSKKGAWRLKASAITRKVDDVASRHISGKHIPMGELYELAYKVARIGEQGIALRGRMKEFGVKQQQRVHVSFASTCKLLESASRILERIAEVQGTPLIAFPLFVSDLEATTEIETEALAALDELKKEVEGG